MGRDYPSIGSSLVSLGPAPQPRSLVLTLAHLLNCGHGGTRANAEREFPCRRNVGRVLPTVSL